MKGFKGTIRVKIKREPIEITTSDHHSLNEEQVDEQMQDDSFLNNEVSSQGTLTIDESEDDLMNSAMEDEVTAQLAISGRVGVAAAAAILSAKGERKKGLYKFEINPALRKRKQTRLLKKLNQVLEEFTTTVGTQAVVLVAKPGKSKKNFTCFGSRPLEEVVRNMRPIVMEHLDSALERYSNAVISPQDNVLYELPPLLIDGIPTPVEKMTQSQLRTFIPLMLKYSTGRGKPGWGKEDTRPPWWPPNVPWENIRVDIRTEMEKRQVPWNHALQQIVINCYVYHGREDLLPVFGLESGNEKNGYQDVKPNLVID